MADAVRIGDGTPDRHPHGHLVRRVTPHPIAHALGVPLDHGRLAVDERSP